MTVNQPPDRAGSYSAGDQGRRVRTGAPDTAGQAHPQAGRKRVFRASPALKFVLMVGVMSFFADFTYEGSRSVIGPYLGLLGAGALAIAVITGFGEFLGYGLRLVSGRSARYDRPADHNRRVHPADVGGAAAGPGRKLAGRPRC